MLEVKFGDSPKVIWIYSQLIWNSGLHVSINSVEIESANNILYCFGLISLISLGNV